MGTEPDVHPARSQQGIQQRGSVPWVGERAGQAFASLWMLENLQPPPRGLGC